MCIRDSNYPSQDEGESGVYIGGNAEVIINKSNVGIVVFEKGMAYRMAR